MKSFKVRAQPNRWIGLLMFVLYRLTVAIAAITVFKAMWDEGFVVIFRSFFPILLFLVVVALPFMFALRLFSPSREIMIGNGQLVIAISGKSCSMRSPR